jgi:hypothetical protein
MSNYIAPIVIAPALFLHSEGMKVTDAKSAQSEHYVKALEETFNSEPEWKYYNYEYMLVEPGKDFMFKWCRDDIHTLTVSISPKCVVNTIASYIYSACMDYNRLHSGRLHSVIMNVINTEDKLL